MKTLLINRSRGAVQIFELAEIKSYQRRDGSPGQFAVWSSRCRVCDAEYQLTTSVNAEAIARSKAFTPHCPTHRRRRPKR